MMLTVYLIALAVGGTMVLMSLLLGGDHDVEGDADADLGADVDHGDADADYDHAGHDHDHDFGWEGFDAWVPVTSLRFWIFFLAFFGLTGTLLAGFSLSGNAIVTAVAAVAVGYVSGVTCVRVIRRLHGQVVDSSVTDKDFIGATGRVVLPIAPNKTGKVRLEVKGRTVEVLADTEEGALEIGQVVMVYSVEGDGRVVVQRGDQLS